MREAVRALSSRVPPAAAAAVGLPDLARDTIILASSTAQVASPSRLKTATQRSSVHESELDGLRRQEPKSHGP